MLKIRELSRLKYTAVWQNSLSLIRPTKLVRRILNLKNCRVGLSLILLSNVDHKYGPKYLKECFP